MRISDCGSDVCSSDRVLRSWRNSTTRPWIVLVEAIDPLNSQPSDGEWRDLLEAHRYHEVLFDGLNRYFVADERTELDDKLRAQIGRAACRERVCEYV